MKHLKEATNMTMTNLHIIKHFIHFLSEFTNFELPQLLRLLPAQVLPAGERA